MQFRQRFLLIGAFILIGLGLLLIIQAQSLGKLRLIFCDVGQGDGILVVTPSAKQILVDGGPGSKILDCLGKQMPFWDREIEFMVSTHPQQDHMEGLVGVLASYKVKMIATTAIKNETQLFNTWQDAINAEGAKIYTPKRGDKLLVDTNPGSTRRQVEPVTIEILWPDAASLKRWQEEAPRDLNDSSIVMRVSYGLVCVYLTGDIPKEILQGVIDKPCQILKIAHHGSRTGTNSQVLDAAKPKIAIMQLGKNNRFGHPHREVVDLLELKGINILRNDINGIIEVNTDGKSFSVNSEH